MTWTVSQGAVTIGDVLSVAALAELLRAFDLGDGTLSAAPVARGRVGEIWRLDATSGVWAVKTEVDAVSEVGLAPSVAFHEAAVDAGVPAPPVRRTVDGRVYADAGGIAVRVLGWVDMDDPDPDVDPAAVGALVARLHRVPAARGHGRAETVGPWFSAPVGAPVWDALVTTLRQAGAPFAEDLAAHRDELVGLEALLRPPREVRWCHRDLFADNVRSAPGGGLVVFDFDSSGPASPAEELAFVLVEYATSEAPVHARVDVSRAQALWRAYRDAGGPGRLVEPADFSLVVAVLGHITQLAATRWLAATDDATRADLAGWVGELTRRPLTRRVVEELLDAAR